MAYTCPKCGMTSHNPNDEREGYCGNCHDWTGLSSIEDIGVNLSPGEVIVRAHRLVEDTAPELFARNPDLWVGNNDGSRMAWWCINGVWHWRHLSAENVVLAEGEGGP
jgi:hypothetical protein